LKRFSARANVAMNATLAIETAWTIAERT